MDSKSVTADTFESQYQFVDSDLVLLRRNHYWRQKKRTVDVMGTYWWVFFGNFHKNQVLVNANGQWTGKSGWSAAVFPPHSIIEWEINPGQLVWEAYISQSQYPQHLPKTPTVMSGLKTSPILLSNDLIRFVELGQEQVSIARCENPSSVAKQTKEYVDNHFTSDLSLNDIAEDLNFNPSVMSRYFKNSYGISPSSYRNKMRIMQAKCLMLFQNMPVLDAAIEVGFSSPGGFNKAFHKVLDHAPSKLIS